MRSPKPASHPRATLAPRFRVQKSAPSFHVLITHLLTRILFDWCSIPHASPPTPLSTSTGGTPATTPGIQIPGAHGSSPVRESSFGSVISSPLVTENLADVGSSSSSAHGEIPPSTSPTSSYPIATSEIHHHSPLNPASSASATITAEDAEQTIPPASIDLSKVVPGLNKADLPNAATPLSGEEADTEMA